MRLERIASHVHMNVTNSTRAILFALAAEDPSFRPLLSLPLRSAQTLTDLTACC